MNKITRKKMNRSGKAYCDICNENEILQIHHINGRDLPNSDHPSNLCNICPNCHSRTHYGFIIIERWIRSTNGLRLLWHKKEETGLTGEDSNPPLLI